MKNGEKAIHGPIRCLLCTAFVLRNLMTIAVHRAPAKTGTINARVAPALKREAEAILLSLGVSTTEAVTMFLHQVVLHKGLPFPLRVPNAETLAAIRDARVNRDDGTRYENAAALMRDLWPADPIPGPP